MAGNPILIVSIQALAELS